MKKITSIRQLRGERSLLDRRKKDLVESIRRDWGQLKKEADPVDTATRIFQLFKGMDHNGGMKAKERNTLSLVRLLRRWWERNKRR